MGEARKIIIIFLILLFVIIGLGVTFSRLSKEKKSGPILGEVLDNIFFNKSLRVTPTPTPAKDTLITIRSNSTAPYDNKPTGQVPQSGNNTTINPAQPNSIPATGTPTLVLVFSGAGLTSGLLLKRFSR